MPRDADFHVLCRILLHAVNLRHGTDGFTSPPKEGVLRIFSPLNPTASAGFEPANLGTKGQHATSAISMVPKFKGYCLAEYNAARFAIGFPTFWGKSATEFYPDQWRTQEFFSGGSTNSVEDRAERTGIWGR